ncbi:MAG TPA: ankyrin repeat domain-containing protein [Pyrinomonadaceae bacterium]
MKKQKDLLDRVSVEKPCTMDWNKMFGNDEVRFCEHCVKRVHNLSAMTRKDAERLVKKSNGNLCIRYYTDKNKKIVFGDAPVQITRLGRRVSQFAASVFTAALSVSAVAAQGSARIAPENQAAPVQTNETKLKQSSGGAANLGGTVKDPQGAVVPGVTVTLFDGQNNKIAATVSNDEGFYKFEVLADGVYNVEFSMTNGFAAHKIENVQISAGKETTADAEMKLGESTVMMGVVGTSSPVVEWIRHSEKRTNINVEPTEQLLEFFNDVMSDDLANVKNAVRAGAFVDAKMPDGTTALMYADSAKMAKFLIRRGGDVHAQNMYGETALMFAVRDAEMTKFFLRAGLNPNAASSFGVTPLMYAMEFDDAEPVQILIKAGANVNNSDVDGRTALMLAAFEGEMEIIRLLVESGANVNARDAKGKTVLMYAVEGNPGDEAENIRYLIENGADVNAHESEGNSVLMLALEEEDEETIKLLKSYGAIE